MMPTCQQKHALVRDPRAHNTCNVCGKEGTSYRCASGCDYDVCYGCFNPKDWRSSPYMRLYRRTARRPALADVRTGLLEVVDPPTDGKEYRVWEELGRLAAKPIEPNEEKRMKSVLISQWTGVGGRGRGKEKGTPLFSLLNQDIVGGNDARLRHWMPFIRAFHGILNYSGPGRDLVVYRGSKYAPAAALRTFARGGAFRANMYVAASLERGVAEAFARDRVIVEIHVAKGCKNAREVHEISDLSDEREVLMVPYSPFRVKDVAERDDGGATVVVDVLDGMVMEAWEDTHIDLDGMNNHPSRWVDVFPL